MEKEHFIRGTKFNERLYLISFIFDAVRETVNMPIIRNNREHTKEQSRSVLHLTRHNFRRAQFLHDKLSKEGVDIFNAVVYDRVYEKTYAKEQLINWFMRTELMHMDRSRLAFFNLYKSCFDITSKDDFLDRVDNLCEKTQLTKASIFNMPPKIFEFAFKNETKFTQDISCIRQIARNCKNWKDDPDSLINLYNVHCFKHSSIFSPRPIEPLPTDRLRMLSKFAKDEIGDTKSVSRVWFFAQRRHSAITPQPGGDIQKGGPR